MSIPYREESLKAPRLIIATYSNLTDCFIVSFEDYSNFLNALSQWSDEYKTHKVIADRTVEVGKLYYIGDQGTVMRYTLKDFKEISK